MKLRTTLMIGALAVGGACSKKDNKAPDPGANPAPAPSPKPNEGTTKPETPKTPDKPAPLTGDAIAKKYIACTDDINAGKWDEFKKDCISDDYKGHQANGPDISGTDPVIAAFKAMKTGFPDLKFSPQLVVVNGRSIYGVGLMTGTNSADWSMGGHDMKKTDKKIGQLIFHKLSLNDDNKVNEEWQVSDPRTMMGQLGALPPQAGPTRPAADKGLDGAPIIVIAKDDATEKKNIETWNKGTAAFNDHKIPDLLATYADDATESDQADDKDHKGKKEMEAGLKMFWTAFPDVKVEKNTVIAAGDYVIEIGEVNGTNKGAMGPIKATGKTVNQAFAEVGLLKDGKVTQLWRFRNGLAVAVQLGLVPDPMKAAPDAPKDGAKDAPKDAPKGVAPAPAKDKKPDDKKAGGW